MDGCEIILYDKGEEAMNAVVYIYPWYGVWSLVAHT